MAWGPRYVRLARRLAASALKYVPDCLFITLEPEGEPSSPRDAWARRWRMILPLLEEGERILYIDADAVFRGRPEELRVKGNADFRAVPDGSGPFWRLGVLEISPTMRAARSLRRLAERLEAGPFFNDEPIFGEVVQETGATVEELPRNLNWCAAWGDRERFGNHLPLIETNV